MKLRIQWGHELIFCDKPAGLATHAPDVDKAGFVEWVERRLQTKLWVIHRLDKTTTGSIAFATTATKADEMRRLFAANEMHKFYWFLTDRKSLEGELTIRSRIEKVGKTFTSDLDSPANSTTHFKLLKRSVFFELWEARPETGKAHQIRLHARDAGMPLLGDELYGGTPFPHLCLHAMTLKVPGEKEWTCPAPRFFERLGVLRDPELVRILACLDRRERLYHFLGSPAETVRLIHNDFPDFRMDRQGAVTWLNWYRETPPTERDLERWDFVRHDLQTSLVIQKRQNRGQDPNTQTLWELGDTPDRWEAQENDVLYEFRKDQGLSSGLFLDQRRNRERVRGTVKDQKVLNLFAYTAGFSVCAALGGAEKVTTVDLSKSFLEWGKTNFRLNRLDPEQSEWSAADSFVFLKGAIKRNRKWDLIICDPPSFSRAGKEIFKLKDDLERLLELCATCLTPHGILLFSCNLESQSSSQIEQRIQKRWPKAKIERGDQDLDFELPNEERSLKSFWIRF